MWGYWYSKAIQWQLCEKQTTNKLLLSLLWYFCCDFCHFGDFESPFSNSSWLGYIGKKASIIYIYKKHTFKHKGKKEHTGFKRPFWPQDLYESPSNLLVHTLANKIHISHDIIAIWSGVFYFICYCHILCRSRRKQIHLLWRETVAQRLLQLQEVLGVSGGPWLPDWEGWHPVSWLWQRHLITQHSTAIPNILFFHQS